MLSVLGCLSDLPDLAVENSGVEIELEAFAALDLVIGGMIWKLNQEYFVDVDREEIVSRRSAFLLRCVSLLQTAPFLAFPQHIAFRRRA